MRSIGVKYSLSGTARPRILLTYSRRAKHSTPSICIKYSLRISRGYWATAPNRSIYITVKLLINAPGVYLNTDTSSSLRLLMSVVQISPVYVNFTLHMLILSVYIYLVS